MFGETREQKDRKRRMLASSHVSGLPIPDETGCSLIFEEDNLTIKTVEVDSIQFKVSYNKIVNLQTQTNYDLQNTMVSSAGGAVAGAMLFGAPGAMIGGRAKKKKVITVEHFLVITYKKDNALENLHFQLREEVGEMVVIKAEKLIEKYRPLTACPAPGTSPVVEL